MVKPSKCLMTLLIFYCIIGGALAQSVTTPATPNFTLTYRDNSYVVEPTTFYTTDPYTGKQTATGSTIGAAVANTSITVRIVNQPFTPYTDADNNTVQLYYDVRWKGQFTDSWEGSLFPYVYVAQDSSRSYTDVRLGFTSNYWTVADDSQISAHAVGNPVEVQVRACVGYITEAGNPPSTTVNKTFTGVTSDWSSTQTVFAGKTASPSPTQTQSVQPTTLASESATPAPSDGNPALNITSILLGIIVALVVAVAVLAVALFRKNRTKQSA
jgi:hypothetical protein